MLKHNLPLLAWCLIATAVSAADERATVEPVETWCNVFADRGVTFHYTIRPAAPLEGRLDWSLSVNGRTIEHGQLPVRAAAAQPAEVALPLRTPAVKDGVVLRSQLTVALLAAGDAKPTASHRKPLWIFPRNPFFGRTQWLEELKITLFDPQGKTAEVLKDAGVPFKTVRNTAALEELTAGLLLIGEGTAWTDYRGLGETMVQAAARGVPVLCLAPGEGATALPGTADTDLPAPSSVTWRREDIIAEIDKRLDAVAWPPDGRIAASGLVIRGSRDRVIAEVSPAGRGWPWWEIDYPAAKGRLIVCGFGIIRQWEAGPAPRYLLAALFERLTSTQLPQERND